MFDAAHENFSGGYRPSGKGDGGGGAVSKTFLSKNEAGGLDVPLHLARAKLDPIDLGPVV